MYLTPFPKEPTSMESLFRPWARRKRFKKSTMPTETKDPLSCALIDGGPVLDAELRTADPF